MIAVPDPLFFLPSRVSARPTPLYVIDFCLSSGAAAHRRVCSLLFLKVPGFLSVLRTRLALSSSRWHLGLVFFLTFGVGRLCSFCGSWTRRATIFPASIRTWCRLDWVGAPQLSLIRFVLVPISSNSERRSENSATSLFH